MISFNQTMSKLAILCNNKEVAITFSVFHNDDGTGQALRDREKDKYHSTVW